MQRCTLVIKEQVSLSIRSLEATLTTRPTDGIIKSTKLTLCSILDASCVIQYKTNQVKNLSAKFARSSTGDLIHS